MVNLSNVPIGCEYTIETFERFLKLPFKNGRFQVFSTRVYPSLVA